MADSRRAHVQDALTRIYTANKDRLYALGFALTADKGLAEDVVHDVYAPVLTHAVENYVWGWPMPSTDTSLLPPENGPWGRLVGAVHRYPTEEMRLYYNPARDYILEDAAWRKVTEYARTAQGQWHARKMVGPSDIVFIHVDTGREIPGRLFDPDSIR
jgi:hypothetical protein